MITCLLYYVIYTWGPTQWFSLALIQIFINVLYAE